ncbi:MAG: class IV adenylate cyclase [Acidobacteria bacterium]|nr:class IV adenylate cyclase [Acidobacteriota bacterium]MCA1641695.1 class IV adenylate cyclase [Acidobacteriota bacterium]
MEIEKKYRLTPDAAEQLRRRLRELGADGRGVEFEENTLYAGANLEPGRKNLRLRRVNGRAVLTLKERQPSADAVKLQREDETGVGDADTIDRILRALGYAPALVYEKRRETWRLDGVEVVIDELPFGWFAEIEGERDAILRAEGKLGLEGATAELRTYPDLSREHGVRREGVIEARFDSHDRND